VTLPVEYLNKHRDAGTNQYLSKDRCCCVPISARVPMKTPVEPFVHAIRHPLNRPDSQGPGRFGIQAFHCDPDQISCQRDAIFRKRERTYAAAHGLSGERAEAIRHRQELVGWHDLFRGS
jgi:hypothetical protein